jgi:hypothetical protein
MVRQGDNGNKMRIFGLYITMAKKHDQDNALIGKLLGENAILQKSTEKLLTIVKGSRQVRRAAERRLTKGAWAAE